MKALASLLTSLVLTAAMLTGCGCTNRNMDNTPPTSLLPSSEATTAPSTAATETTTMPTMESTQTSSEPTINHGNGPLVDESTSPSESTGATEGTARGKMGIG